MVNVTELNRGPQLDVDSLNGADITGASSDQILVTQGDGTLAVETQAEGPNPYDQAQTFNESDLTITHNNTTVSSGSISLKSEGTTASRPDDDSSGSITGARGLEINPNINLSGLRVTVSSETSGVQDVFIADGSENILDEKTSGYTGGDVVELNASLSSGTSYYVGVYNDGNSYTYGTFASTSYPYTSADIDITSGVLDPHPDDSGSLSTFNSSFGIKDVTPLIQTTSGNALIEWDRGIPTDIYSWDVATFTRTLDGETVTVDVEDGSGTVLLSDMDRNTDISSIADQTNIKLRANLSRNDTSNNPTLDSAYRSWFV